MEHYVICDSSYGITATCKHTECPYHLEHYEPKPEDWIVIHRVNVINMGGSCPDMESNNG